MELEQVLEATKFNWQRVGPFVWCVEHGHRYGRFFSGYVMPQVNHAAFNKGYFNGYYEAVIFVGYPNNGVVSRWEVEWSHQSYSNLEGCKQQLTRVLAQRCFCDGCVKYMHSEGYGKIAPNSLEAMMEIEYVGVR